jgi:hypothetical protein
MVTISPASATAVAPSTSASKSATSSPTTSSSAASQSVTAVTLSQSASATNAALYAPNGLAVSAAVPVPPTQVWEQNSSDPITVLMATNFALPSYTSSLGFKGLGAALLDRFKTGTSDTDNFSQSIAQFAPGAQPDAIRKSVAQTQLHTEADNQIKLTIKTASGAQVAVSLGSEQDGLAVQVQVTDGTLTDADRDALSKLADAFQGAIDGLAKNPPQLDLTGLTKFDPAVLSSIDLHADVNSQALDFHADSTRRTVSSSGPIGELKLSVDLTNPAILGNAKQQASAIDRYLKQFDYERQRGHGDTTLMDMFKDAFSELNSNYPATAKQRADTLAPQTISLTQIDHSVITGLADFSASVTQNSASSNPLQPGEKDTFSYQLSQQSSVKGPNQLNRSITQTQQAHLSASFHVSSVPGVSIGQMTDSKSQNYTYHQINDDASSVATIAYNKGALIKASLVQSASQSERMQTYEMGKLTGDDTTTGHGSHTEDFLAHFKSALEGDDPKTALNGYAGQQALEAINDLTVLQSDPAQLDNFLQGQKLRALLLAPSSVSA